jgi:hypothetical protein
LEEEKATLEEMVESHNELLMERLPRLKMRKRKKRMPIMEEMPPHPLLPHHHLRHPLLPCLRRSTKKALWRQSLSKKPRCHMRLSW